jgi:hypothetical protein
MEIVEIDVDVIRGSYPGNLSQHRTDIKVKAAGKNFLYLSRIVILIANLPTDLVPQFALAIASLN